MPQLKLTPESIALELAALNKAAARSLGVIRRLSDVRLGATPRESVMTIDGVTLYRYCGSQMPGQGYPILLVYALVNRPEMMDLQRGRSLIAALLEREFDVYLIDWGYPGISERRLGLDDYISRYLDTCVDHLCKRLDRDRMTLLGICQGGTFSVCYAALNPDKVDRLITTVTPIDFHTPDDMLSHFIRHVDIDALVDARGNITGDILNALFLSLKPYRLSQQKYVRFIDQIDDEEAAAMFLRMEQWIFDSPMLTARVCREFGRKLYQENRLVKGDLVIGGAPVDVRNLKMPILNIYARDDHLVPPASSRALAGLAGSARYAEHELPGGHIGVYVGTGSRNSVSSIVDEWIGMDAK